MKVDAHDSREKDLSHCCSFSPRPVIEGDRSTKSRVVRVAPSSTKDKMVGKFAIILDTTELCVQLIMSNEIALRSPLQNNILQVRCGYFEWKKTIGRFVLICICLAHRGSLEHTVGSLMEHWT